VDLFVTDNDGPVAPLEVGNGAATPLTSRYLPGAREGLLTPRLGCAQVILVLQVAPLPGYQWVALGASATRKNATSQCPSVGTAAAP